MWVLDNRTPYKAERTWVRDPSGMHHWIVVVKATYDISENGELTLADEQAEPLYLPVYSGEDGKSSVLYASDLTGMKPGTDVLVNGNAYAIGGKPATHVTVVLEAKDLRKELSVYGDRYWERGLMRPEASFPARFDRMPIIYERAFGGIDDSDPDPAKHRIDLRNPVGVGFSTKKAHLYGTAVPNIEYPHRSQRQAGPAGFGAIASFWSPRRELGGTYDDNWKNTQMPLLPKDYDERCHLCSPLDQRSSDYFRGGELISLTNMTESGFLRFALPEVFLFFTTWFGKAEREHRAKLVTVVIEPDHPRVILTWQTSLEVRQHIDYLDKTVIADKKMERFADVKNSLCDD